jgi:hypothetical protein
MRSLLAPAALKPGDRVAVVAPSGPPGRPELDLGLAALRSIGLVPEVFASTRSVGPYPYLAADDKVRAEDLARALSEPGYAAVFCARGGYGVQRVLELLDWDRVGTPKPRARILAAGVRKDHGAQCPTNLRDSPCRPRRTSTGGDGDPPPRSVLDHDGDLYAGLVQIHPRGT